jgi:hypothetical protein
MSEQDYAQWPKPIRWGTLIQLPSGRWQMVW